MPSLGQCHGLKGMRNFSLTPAKYNLLRRSTFLVPQGSRRQLPFRCKAAADTSDDLSGADVQLEEDADGHVEGIFEDGEAVVAPQDPVVTEDLVTTFAYLLWAENGRPSGAEYGPMSREILQRELESGRDIVDLENEVYKRRSDLELLEQQQREEEEVWKSVEAGQAQSHFRPMGTLPDLSCDPESEESEGNLPESLMDLLKLARTDATTVYSKTFEFGHGSRLLAVLRAPDGPNGRCIWEIYSSADEDIVLHWGVSHDGTRTDWNRPMESILPEDSTLPDETISAETLFQSCDVDDLNIIVLEVETDQDVTGIQFVLRSSDGSQWWQNGMGNFQLPLPRHLEPTVTAVADIAPIPPLPVLPDELVNVHAFLLWVENGQPSGADFSQTSGEMLLEQLRAGRSLSDIEHEIYGQRDHQLHAQAEMNPSGMIYSMMFKFGATGRLLAVLRAPEDSRGDYTWEIITDTTKDIVLHWGVSRNSDVSDWVRPESDLLPLASSLADGSIAADTWFQPVGDEGLKHIVVTANKQHRITGLQFVLRMEDGSRWWQDGPDSFKLPLPCELIPEEEDVEMSFDEEPEELAQILEAVSPEIKASEIDTAEIETPSETEATEVELPEIIEEPEDLIPEIPDELVYANAFLLWIDHGKPSGADFGEVAREALLEELKAGRDLCDLEDEVYNRRAAEQEKMKRLQLAMDAEAELAQENSLQTWVFTFGDQERLLAVLRESSDDLLNFELVTDSSSVVLHWGVCRNQDMSDWTCPDSVFLLPESTTMMDNGISAESPFQKYGDEGLKHMHMSFHRNDGFAGIQFVLRSEDGAQWWSDGAQNFKLSLPFPPMPVEEVDEQLDEQMNSSAAAQPDDTVTVETPSIHEDTFEDAADVIADEVPIMDILSEDVVNTNAYLMWFDNGQPSGADFGQASREMLMNELQAGRDLSEIEDEVYQRKSDLDKLQNLEPEDYGSSEHATDGDLDSSTDDGSKYQQLDMGFALQHFRSRPAMDLLQYPEVQMEISVPENLEDPDTPFAEKVEAAKNDSQCISSKIFSFGSKSQLLALLWAPKSVTEICTWELIVASDEDVVLHWGLSFEDDRSDWTRPDGALLPDASVLIPEGISAETQFQDCGDGLKHIVIAPRADMDVTGMQFVLRSEDGSEWWKLNGSSNFKLSLPRVVEGRVQYTKLEAQFSGNPVGLEIAEAENESMWTLMHRYNKASSILESLLSGDYGQQVEPVDAVAHIYVWLRFSANRLITWQRNYNTQPRILSAAQEQLIQSICKAHAASSGETQEWARLCLSTLGRGGDGQRIRDEILHIMHRNSIPETKGTWTEEWHQKLHNNTTSDDIFICEAYLVFLNGGGDNAAYWKHLNDNGITRERMESFERPILSEPEDFHWMRGALIGEYENYLGILKSVHGGTDLFTSAQRADWCTPPNARGYLDFVMHNLHGPILPLIEAAVEARTELKHCLSGNRDLLYLDLALEGTIRWAAEKAAGVHPLAAVQMIGPLLQNLVLTAGDNEELCYSLAAWNALPVSLRTGQKPSSTEEALKAAATVDRIRHSLGQVSDSVSNRIEPISLTLGMALGVEDWNIKLFAEEVVRGGPAFAVSQSLKTVDGLIRQLADMGEWQVISPGAVTGFVVVEPELHLVQDNVYAEPTILVVDHVSGEEEIPQGCVAVLTPDAPDVLSHVAVRARNMQCLFATCYDDDSLKKLHDKQGQMLFVRTTNSGSVQWDSSADGTMSRSASDHPGQSFGQAASRVQLASPEWCGEWCIGLKDFNENTVGAKSRSVAALRGMLPDWINLPPSVTIPFGSFEEALKMEENKAKNAELQNAVKGFEDNTKKALQTSRKIVTELQVPPRMKEALSVCMAEAGIPVPETEEDWDRAAKALRGVWASKFNDRAYYAMRKAGIPFMDIRMAVLVMPVIRAEYAFVIHTTNPITSDQDEIYCELVSGLGEVLVSGQFPGRAMAFSARKDDLDNPKLLAYPSKSQQMVLTSLSLIFRSDSNGEDLASFAGAGLFDSITAQECQIRPADYTQDRITNDEGFRKHIMQQICKVGAAIETSMGSPQDIEGVVDCDGKVTVVQSRPQV